MNCKVKQLSDTIDVLLLDLFAGADLSKLAQRGYEGVSHLMNLIVTTYSNSVDEALQAKVRNVLVLDLVEYYAEHGKVG